MAVDAVLWLILAAMIALIWYGCIVTSRASEPLGRHDNKFEHDLDRAA